MFSIPRKFIIIFLTLLQFIAPLVHAHTNEQGSKQGLHVPGLEPLGNEYKTVMAQLKTLQCKVSIDGMFVGVDLGLKHDQANFGDDSGSKYYLHQNYVGLNTAVSKFDINFSPQRQSFVYQFWFVLNSPRAPPLSNKYKFALIS
jgi:hypothetical protein